MIRSMGTAAITSGAFRAFLKVMVPVKDRYHPSLMRVLASSALPE